MGISSGESENSARLLHTSLNHISFACLDRPGNMVISMIIYLSKKQQAKLGARPCW